jgi:hypothetical protein
VSKIYALSITIPLEFYQNPFPYGTIHRTYFAKYLKNIGFLHSYPIRPAEKYIVKNNGAARDPSRGCEPLPAQPAREGPAGTCTTPIGIARTGPALLPPPGGEFSNS